MGHEIDDLLATAHRARQAWDAVRRAAGADSDRTQALTSRRAWEELDIAMLDLVYRVERVRSLGYGADLVVAEAGADSTDRLSAHLAAHAGNAELNANTGAAGAVIRVWRYGDAPEPYRRQFDDADPDDWLVQVPQAQARSFIPWLAGPELCGYFGVTAHTQPDGSEVRVASARHHTAAR